MTAEIDVRSAPGLGASIDVAWIADHVRRAAELLAQREKTDVLRISVLVVDDARMQRLHERHHGTAETTDVLTFDLRDDRAQPVEADVVICADEAARRAAELGHSIERELLLYCVHGLLHCLGYDDHDDAGRVGMHAREDEILQAIGVGATFAPSPTPSDGGDLGSGVAPENRAKPSAGGNGRKERRP